MQLYAIEYQQKNLEIDKEFLINEKKQLKSVGNKMKVI